MMPAGNKTTTPNRAKANEKAREFSIRQERFESVLQNAGRRLRKEKALA
jgi:hypothetical protein